MHLVAVLASGVIGASNGWAELYRRGTSTRATWYTDFEASSSNSSGSNITLDGNGGAVVYVNELVTVVVKDSSGTTVRQFTAGDAATAVEVISDSFTGTDYASGSSGVSKPTTLAAALDLLDNSFGAADFKVRFAGSDQNLQTVLASIPTYINVKSPTYGATGDGVTDDTAAITAALAAATDGRVVFFPAGSYIVSSSLTVPAGASILGVGAWASIIVFTHATSSALVYGTDVNAGTFQKWIRDIAIITQSTGSGNLIAVTGDGHRLAVQNVIAEPYSGSAISLAAGVGAGLVVDNLFCFKQHTGNPAISAVFSDTTGQCSVTNCQFQLKSGFTASSDSFVRISYGHVSGCRFDFANNASGDMYGVRAPAAEFATRPVMVGGCTFVTAGASGNLYAFGNGSTNAILDLGNDIGTSGTAYKGITNTSSFLSANLSVAGGSDTTTWVTATGNITVGYETYSMLIVRANNDMSGATVTLDSNIQPGRRIAFAVWNKSGTNWTPPTPTFGPGFVDYASYISVGACNNTNVSIFYYDVVYINGKVGFVCTQAAQNFFV